MARIGSGRKRRGRSAPRSVVSESDEGRGAVPPPQSPPELTCRIASPIRPSADCVSLTCTCRSGTHSLWFTQAKSSRGPSHLQPAWKGGRREWSTACADATARASALPGDRPASLALANVKRASARVDGCGWVRARVSEGYLEALVFLAELADLLPQLLDQLLLCATAGGATPPPAAARLDGTQRKASGDCACVRPNRSPAGQAARPACS